MSETMDINEIIKYLPHRYPFLLIDRVIELELGKSIKAIKNVTINEPFFPGHFPGYPVMPGVLIMEALAQAAGVLSFKSDGKEPDGSSLYFFAGIDNARFKRQVVPGDQLTLCVELLQSKRGIYKYAAKAYVGTELAAEAELLCAERKVNKSL
ncbi:3-hydroxyacyl-ACP dehydratase FabZ [Amantichitinum ursilacus]|uniref:3-hydroxyacyl-[acyl-carrier-protein] dehydratase FabZ n=1 Tax=Amantichitinum ursilacus TaxID=857265 RepID=A0A0N1JTM9_9NEIS|nr:3-hydroxyacyl-ACP dehydratase FabZ [Amantichitinum ursilacus]KPC55222.1 3-hydroxyacyl-[acyl-carrier-protein] dehydratase FabZ [Amantichitinum ursilacus]